MSASTTGTPASPASPQGHSALTASQQEALKRVTKIIDAFVLRNDCAPFLEPVDWRGLELYDYPTIIKKPMDLGTIKRKLERNQYKSAAYCVADIRRVWNNCMTYNTVGSDFYILAKNCSKRFEDRYRRIRNEYDIGEEPPKSDTEDNDGKETKGNSKSVAAASRRRGQEQGDDDEEENGDEENEFQGNDEDDEMEEEEDDEEDDEEMAAKASDASGSPAGSNYNKNKRQRSGTPPPVTLSTASFDVKMQLTTNLLYLNGTDLGYVMSLLEQHCPKVLETYNNNSSSGSSKVFPIPECMEINIDLLMDEYYNTFSMIQQYCNDHMVNKRFAASAHGGNGLKIKDVSNRRKERKA